MQRLGFTELESEIYVVLSGRRPMTAYAISRALGKPTANVYKAVQALARKGAVLLEDGDTQQCRAVPPELLLTRLEQRTHDDIEKARTLFAHTDPAGIEERVYRLETPQEVIARCTEMLDRAEQVAVIDAFPAALDAVADAARRAAARGVKVYVEAYAPIEIEGANVVVVSHGAMSVRRWRSEQINVVVDGREHVASLLSEDLATVYQAIWSDSLYLSCLMHAGRIAEHTLIRLGSLKRQPGVPAALRRVLDEHPFFANSQVPGHAEIVARFGDTMQPPAATRAAKRKIK